MGLHIELLSGVWAWDDDDGDDDDGGDGDDGDGGDGGDNGVDDDDGFYNHHCWVWWSFQADDDVACMYDGIRNIELSSALRGTHETDSNVWTQQHTD